MPHAAVGCPPPVRPAAPPFRLASPVGLACLVVFLHYVGAYMRMPLLPLYARAGGAGAEGVGLVMGAFMLVAAACAVPGGLLADRIGRRRLIVAGVAASAVASLLLPLGGGAAYLAAVLALAGGAMAALTPAVMAYIGEVGGPEAAGRAYGWYTTAVFGGMSLGPGLGGLAADVVGFRATFVASGGVLLATLALAMVGLPEARGPGARGRGSGMGLRQVAADPVVLACWEAMFCLMFAWGALLAFLPLYAQDLGLAGRTIGALFGVQALCNVGIRTPVGYLSDRLGARTPFVPAGMLVFAAGAVVVPALRSGPALAAAIALTGFGHGMGAVATGAALGEATAPAVRGAAMGGYSMALYGGIASGSMLVGPVIGTRGFGAGFAVASAVLGVGAAVFHGLARRRRPA